MVGNGRRLAAASEAGRLHGGLDEMKRAGKTPVFRGPRGEAVHGSLSEITYLRLRGVDQWVMIRGENVANLAV